MSGNSESESLELALRNAFAQENDAEVARLAAGYRAALVRFARSMIHEDHRAEDLAQEALAALSSQPPEGSVRAWLFRLVRNRAIDHLRRRAASPTAGPGLRTGFDAPTATAGPATRAARREREQIVQEALAGLPDEYRTALWLKHVDGLSREEIATLLEVSEATVKGRLARGAEILREELQRHPEWRDEL